MTASPDCYQYSAFDPAERERAVKQTFQTIDYAQRLGAPFVVLHCGQVRMNPITDELIALAKEGELLSKRYVRKKVKAVQVRESRAPRYLRRVKDCLKRVIDYAATKDVRLGLEGRRGYEEIPSEREIPQLLEEFDAPHFGYWHDIGHLQIKENLGFLNHAEWLQAIGPRTFGVHLQDVIWPAQDHQVPFAGHVDFDRLLPLLPADCLQVWELSPRRTTAEVQRGLQLWHERFGR
jgi:sugar phosphate isomerase/epimerase